MALMMSNLYEALIAANVPPDKAKAAAEEATRHDPTIADLLHRVQLTQWMITFLIALNLTMFYKVWGF